MVEPFWILMKQEMIGWQWHQLDHCKSFALRSRHTNTPAVQHLIIICHLKCFVLLKMHQIDAGWGDHPEKLTGLTHIFS